MNATTVRRSVRTLVATVVVAATIAAGTTAAHAAGWNMETVETPSAGFLLDPASSKAAASYDGKAHVFYRVWRDGHAEVRHASSAGTGWAVETLDGFATTSGRTTNSVGAGLSAVVAGGIPHVFYKDETRDEVRHAWKDTGGWHFEVVFRRGQSGWSDVANQTAAVDAGNGNVMVFFDGVQNGKRKLAYSAYPLISGYTASNTPILTFSFAGGIDGAGVPNTAGVSQHNVGAGVTAVMYQGGAHLFYRDDDTGDLRHTWQNVAADWRGPYWLTETLDGESTVNGRTTHDVVGNDGATVTLVGGLPHLFYEDTTTKDLRHAWWTGSVWGFETLDGDRSAASGRVSGAVGDSPSVTVLGGVPHVFYGYNGGGLRHAWLAGTWGYETLDGSHESAPYYPGRVAEGVGGGLATVVAGSTIHAFYTSWSSPSFSGYRLRHAVYP